MTESPPAKEDKIMEKEWMIRPCFLYQEEYSECTSIKDRFHQYFIHGETTDCSQWKKDHNNCKLWHNKRDENAFKELVESEEKRRMERLGPHYGNTVWKKRRAPPDDWNKPLPEWWEKRNAATYLAIKAAELHGGAEPTIQKQLCSIL